MYHHHEEHGKEYGQPGVGDEIIKEIREIRKDDAVLAYKGHLMILARENPRFKSWDERAEILLKIPKN